MAQLPPSVRVQRQDVATISNPGSHQYQITQVNGGTNLQGDNYGQINQPTSHFHYADYSSRRLEFLRSLDPAVTTARYNRITDTMYHTLEWAFNEEGSVDPKPLPSPSFPEWLRGPIDTFLVSGKPGSGKSTFMKFLAKHPKTLYGLNEWAVSNPVIILFHGFWASGTKHEHSMKGLLASCIYQLAERVPDLLEQSNLLSKSVLKCSIDHWSTDELHDVFFSLLEQSPTCCCLFLDGLDEFDHQDDDDRLFEFVAEVQSRSRTKVCLSSRPVPHILKRLARSPTMKLQDHTRNDMYKHVWNTMRQKIDITEQDEMARQLESLAEEMCNKADGVFLRVHYVLHNVCKGLKAADEIPDLRRRIDELPSEVVEMYKLMWKKNNRDHPVHAEQAAKILSMHKDFPMPFFQLVALVEPTLANHCSAGQNPIGEDRLDQICNKLLLRLPTLSAGLLECREVRHFTASRTSSGHDGILNLHTKSYRPEATWRRMEVRFIHRTVAEFLTDNASGGALLSDVHCEHVTMRDYVQSLLACFSYEVVSLTCLNIMAVCSTLSSVRKEEAYIIDQIDATCSELVGAQYPTLLSSTRNWVQSLVEEVEETGYTNPMSSRDYPSLLISSSASEYCIMHLLNTRGSAWTPYYKGWLASCLLVNLGSLLLAFSYGWTSIVHIFRCLVVHGADITTPHPNMRCFWYIRSPVLLLLSRLVEALLNGEIIQQDDLVVLLDFIRGINLESQRVTISADVKDLYKVERFYYETPNGPMADLRPGVRDVYLISFMATDLVDMLAAMVGKHASDRPYTGWRGYHGDPGNNESLLQNQYRAHCRTIAMDVGILTGRPEYLVAQLCSSASVRSQILDAVFLPWTTSVSLPVVDGPLWEGPDIDFTIPVPRYDLDSELRFRRMPVDPYTEVSPHEWKQHCSIRDYYARETRIQSKVESMRREAINEWREARPLWSQSRAIYDGDSAFRCGSRFYVYTDYEELWTLRIEPRCVLPPLIDAGSRQTPSDEVDFFE